MLTEKQVSSVELTNACLERIRQVEPELRAIVTVTDELALEQAKRADELIANGDTGLLTGIPALIKDNMCTRGVLTTCSSKMLENFVPPYNATVVEKLNEAGMVIMPTVLPQGFTGPISFSALMANSVEIENMSLVAHLVFMSSDPIEWADDEVDIEEAEETVQSEAFDPVAYVDGIWESRLMPTFDEGAVELSRILAEIEPDASGAAPKDDLIAVANQYGLITVGEAHVYMVKGSGKIGSVNAETSLGTAEVVLDDYDGPIKVQLYIGTRIPSDDTSVRDAVGFISFGDFKEQTEYGKAGTEINKRVLATVLGGLDRDNLVGKTISFKGAFTIRTFNLIQIDNFFLFLIDRNRRHKLAG